jgi:hypothetical protein
MRKCGKGEHVKMKELGQKKECEKVRQCGKENM